MNESIRGALYWLKALSDAGRLFEQALGPLQLVDHVGSFELSVARAPIDSTIDIIRLFLKDMEKEFLPLLGNPRGQYPAALFEQLQKAKTPLVQLPSELAFLQLPTEEPLEQQASARAARKRNLKQDLESRRKNGLGQDPRRRPGQKTLQQLLQIPPEMQRQMVYIELKTNQRQNPWQLACYEHVIGRLGRILLDFDPEACYQDKRVAHQYKLYAASGNKLTYEELGLPKWLVAERLEKLPAWTLCCQCLGRLDELRSPTQVLVTSTLILRYIEVCIGKLLEAEAYYKHVDRSLKALQEQLDLESANAADRQKPSSGSQASVPSDALGPQIKPLDKQETLFKGFQTQDLGMTFDSQALALDQPQAQSQLVREEPTPLEDAAPEPIPQEKEPGQASKSYDIASLLDVNAYELAQDPRIPPFKYEPKPFGMDECQNLYIYLMLTVRPQRLARICSLAANFSFPPIRSGVEAGEYSLMNLTNCCYIISTGFERFKKVRYGVVRPRFRVVAVSDPSYSDPLGVIVQPTQQEIPICKQELEIVAPPQEVPAEPQDPPADQEDDEAPLAAAQTVADMVVRQTRRLRPILRRK